METAPLVRLPTSNFDSCKNDTELHIASLVIHVKPEFRMEVIDYINRFEPCTVYGDDQRPAIVVVLEVTDEHGINQIISDFNTRQGILSVNLVYHHCDSEQTLNQEITP